MPHQHGERADLASLVFGRAMDHGDALGDAPKIAQLFGVWAWG
ncbi:hypothetical protein C8D03_3175 [Bosea sp. 124]|nr:hypothetical protein C8D03_3175 [Bosea sp. 124]